MYPLKEVPNEVLSAFNLNVKHIEQVKKIYKVSTTDGIYALKPVKPQPERISFMHNVLNHLHKNGFTNAIPLLHTKNGELIVIHAGVGYILSSWVIGREANFKNKSDLCLAARAMGSLHHAGEGFQTRAEEWSRNVLGLWPIRWQKGLEDLWEIESPLLRHKYCEQVEQALELIHKDDIYLSQVEIARQKGNLCHRDLVYHNLLIDEFGMVKIIDFDYCALELPAADVGRFLRMVLSHVGWHWSTAKVVLSAYDEVYPLTTAILRLIHAYLTFPHNIWRMFKKIREQRENYYTKQQFTWLYQGMLNDEQHRQFFLQEMSAEIKFIGR